MRISDWSSDVCSSDLEAGGFRFLQRLRSVEGRGEQRRIALEGEVRAFGIGALDFEPAIDDLCAERIAAEAKAEFDRKRAPLLPIHPPPQRPHQVRGAEEPIPSLHRTLHLPPPTHESPLLPP